jgi:trehalose utilization protein
LKDTYFELEHEEMYGEPFGIPTPDEQIFISWFQGGEVFRSGATWKRGNGKIFYFRPGHETYPTYHNATVQMILRNAVKWARPECKPWVDSAPNVPVGKALEKITEWGPSIHAPGQAGLK